MSKGIALITGLNGHIAGPTAEAVLKAGFDVRGTVRRSASGIPIKEELERRGYAGRVEITEVPDMTVEGAFDKAVEGCTTLANNSYSDFRSRLTCPRLLGYFSSSGTSERCVFTSCYTGRRNRNKKYSMAAQLGDSACGTSAEECCLRVIGGRNGSRRRRKEGL